MKPMSTSWVLLLSALFSGEELWVYVEDDPQLHSDHVKDALQTPIATLKAKFPSPACQRYLWELSCLRHDLREQCTVHLLTRDQARIRSDIDLPGYSFSSREHPVPLHPEVYLHWHLIPQHLRYLSQIREYDVSNRESNWSRRTLQGNFVVKKKWFVVYQNSRKYRGSVNGETFDITETTTHTILRFTPEPPLDIPSLPVTITREFQRSGPDGFTESGRITTRYHDSPENPRVIIEAIDMNTGIINQNKEPK